MKQSCARFRMEVQRDRKSLSRKDCPFGEGKNCVTYGFPTNKVLDLCEYYNEYRCDLLDTPHSNSIKPANNPSLHTTDSA